MRVFGYQDAAHLYYVHLGKTADPHANSIFIVNSADRLSIAKTRNSGTNWDDNWHTVRIVRKVKEGSIEVFFDDMTKPVMTAEDRSFTWGQVGLGSFDDTGNFDDVRLWGKKGQKPQENPAVSEWLGVNTFSRLTEERLAKWEPLREPQEAPLQRLRNPKMDITGEWAIQGHLNYSAIEC